MVAGVRGTRPHKAMHALTYGGLNGDGCREMLSALKGRADIVVVFAWRHWCRGICVREVFRCDGRVMYGVAVRWRWGR